MRPRRIPATAAILTALLAAACAPAAEPPPGERAPAAQGPSADAGAQGAAEVARSYFAAIRARRYDEALRLLDESGRPRGASEADFAAAFDRYAEYHAEVGAPGRIEGAAGSLWVEVPVRVHGRMKNGERFAGSGMVVLRRCNDVPGCTEEQRRWRLSAENIALE